MAKKLREFKFTGDVFAMREGEIFFPGEPVLKFSGPLWQLEMLYLWLTIVVSSNTIFSTKAIRTIIAARGKPVIMFGARAQSFESAWKALRSFYICGGIPSSSHFYYLNKTNMWPEKLLNAHTHPFIMSYPSELAAMKAFAQAFPNDEAVILVDTYNFEKGIENFIKVAKLIRKQGGKLSTLYIDSGDLVERAKYARKKLNESGLNDIKILVSGNLDEWYIKNLINRKIDCDGFALATEIVTSADDPKLEVVYKAASIIEPNGHIRHVMKLAPGKKSYPGDKQVFRVKRLGKFYKDIIGLEGESVEGERLLVPVIKEGRLAYNLPKLEEIKDYVKQRVEQLPSDLKSIDKTVTYPVELSLGLEKLIADISKSYR
jgi:nicotinate phosphoribosyltransferase